MKTIEIKQKLLEEALDQLKAAQQDCYVESTQNIIDELELALRQPPVISSVCDLCNGYGRKSANVILGSSKCPKCGI